MDFNRLSALRTELTDAVYAEHIFYKFFSNPDALFNPSQEHRTWEYPECWLARYYCYYVLNLDYIKDAAILDLGSNFNFYSAWAVLNGAKSSHCVEPDVNRFVLGQEYIQIRNLTNSITTSSQNIDDYMKSYNGTKFDVVFLLDLIYYLPNANELLKWVRDVVKPKYIFLESTVADDNNQYSSGHFEVWYPSTDSKAFQSYDSNNNDTKKLALMPSKRALLNTIQDLKFDVLSHYDYHDFIGRGESPPRKTGNKHFYLLRDGAQ